MAKRTKFNRVLKIEDSSNIDSVAYDPSAETLRVAFKGSAGHAEYRYYDVEPEIYTALLNAKSVGKYFNDYIKGAYSRRKLTAR